MDSVIRDQWADALESGEYPQGNGALGRKGKDDITKYCCLGVLCELAVKAGVIQSFQGLGGDDSAISYGTSTYRTASLPSREVMRWAGLDANNPMVDYDDDHQSLAELNDSGTLDFPEIAKLVRTQL